MACAGSTQLITTQTCRVYKSYFTSVQSVTSALQTKRIVIGLLLLRDWTSVSREWFLRPLSRCVDVKFHTCWMTRLNNYASDWSLHVTLAVNKTLEFSQVGGPSVVNKQNKWISNTKAGHNSRNLVNAGGFFLQTGRLDIHFRPY